MPTDPPHFKGKVDKDLKASISANIIFKPVET